MVLRLGLEMLELNRSLPLAVAKPRLLTLALVGGHPLAPAGAAGRDGAAGGSRLRAW